jgi:hypothetical protein
LDSITQVVCQKDSTRFDHVNSAIWGQNGEKNPGIADTYCRKGDKIEAKRQFCPAVVQIKKTGRSSIAEAPA